MLLLDEPFSNLDARLREEMRFELKELQARVGVTTLFVTHDQEEAMILSDRVLVMNAGKIAQDGTPRQIYEEPRSRFVMDFLGQVDHVAARVARTPDGAYVAVIEGVDGAGCRFAERTGRTGRTPSSPFAPWTSACTRAQPTDSGRASSCPPSIWASACSTSSSWDGADPRRGAGRGAVREGNPCKCRSPSRDPRVAGRPAARGM